MVHAGPEGRRGATLRGDWFPAVLMGCGKDALMENVGKSKPRTFPRFPQRLEIQKQDFHFPTAPTTVSLFLPNRTFLLC